MKRTASMILLTASCLVLIVSLVFCFASVYEINRTLHDLASTPGSGGIDYWGDRLGRWNLLIGSVRFGVDPVDA